ncbi:lycopene cyclase family protein [Aurantibacillus circumpalustris]|uniref:lycopene cyclase family protein n=1 Tax=Aurantibacillus circumpalustris TaxID=3036359 RepID=UPI00295A9B4C|nr:lycopene cyclase family protein [Aurantibacillus circumpalustris]
MDDSQEYDFIIAGMGCAGLSLALQLLNSQVKFEKILLIDKDLKNKNDRTWCFWTKEKENWFDSIVFRKWDKFTFESNQFKKEYQLNPYHYLMIRGVDFYDHCLKKLKADARFEIITDEIRAIETHENKAVLTTPTYSYNANYIFNSAVRTLRLRKKEINYVQHFMGWVIKTEKPVFDETCPSFMNFNTEQYNDCRFFYTLPFSKNEALIEYTGFSPEKISDDLYASELKRYIEIDLDCKEYTIESVEQGEIPMTEGEFINTFGERVINIGTAGGNSKPSTGYTFYFIQQNTQQIINQLENNVSLLRSYKRSKTFLMFDSILLDVLNEKKIPSRDVFTLLFKLNPINRLLAFLNEESSVLQTFKILLNVPKKQFIPSGYKKVLRLFNKTDN